MDPIFKRRLPSSLRSLLTDIVPREAWTDAEPDTESRDGILLPSRRTDAGPAELFSPASDKHATDCEDISQRSSVCMLCKCKPSLYTCPRCNLKYCALSCYKSPDHSGCSEDFYKESVIQELKEMGKTEAEGKKKMQEILIRLRKKAEQTEGGMESLLREEGILSEGSEHGQEDTKMNVEAVELLSRLAELQETGEGSAAEIETILQKLKKIGTGDYVGGLLNEDDQSEKEEEKSDLAERLQGLDIDVLSEEELWGLLDKQDKERFVSLIKCGALGGLVPLWRPWWEEHEEGGRVLVEVLQEELSKQKKGIDNTPNTSQEETQSSKDKPAVKRVKGKGKDTNKCQDSALSGVPPISARIPKLSSLCPNASPLVGFSLVNALFGYTFTLFLFNGDTESLMFELCDMVLALSEALSSSRVFNSVHEALDSGETLILDGGYLDKDDAHANDRAVEAVAHILTGRNRQDPTGYCLSALSQLRSVLSQARAALSKEGEEGTTRQKHFLACKKCEFLQAWVLENGHSIYVLAIELWNEHSKRESQKTSMNKAKSVVEQSWKKGKRRGDSKLIEELN